MKNLLSLIIGLLISSAGISQSCLPQGINFTTQSQIDNFQTNYPGCSQIEGGVTISGSDITNLNGLNMVTSIGGYLGLWNNNLLTNLSGLNALSSIGGNFTIQNNPILSELTGLNNLHSIGGEVLIISNPLLTNLNGLNQLTSMVGSLIIYGNIALTSLTGLDNISAGSVLDLDIRGNTSLSTCAVKSVCDYLASPNGTIQILGNATGCNSQAEVEAACATISIQNLFDNNAFSLHPNPSSDNITIKTSVSSVRSQLSIMNLSGQEIIIRQIAEPMTQLDISNLQSGVYFVRLTNERTVSVGKFIKQ